ncbi:MAG: DNA-3-methyladenine glycosylase, partial [Nocardioidaceae bacterium]|nr:DNA-3-methyladenine glycosylase [Nocardioidaceae bacterium]
MPEGAGPLVGDDGVARCPWGGAPAMLAYHDTEWGLPVRGEAAM